MEHVVRLNASVDDFCLRLLSVRFIGSPLWLIQQQPVRAPLSTSIDLLCTQHDHHPPSQHSFLLRCSNVDSSWVSSVARNTFKYIHPKDATRIAFVFLFLSNESLPSAVNSQWMNVPRVWRSKRLGLRENPVVVMSQAYKTFVPTRHLVFFLFFFWREYHTNDVCLGLLNKLPGDGRVSSINQKKKEEETIF